MSWSYDPAALADWLDKQFDENEELQDKWWRESVNYNKLEPFWQSVATLNRYTSNPGLAMNRMGGVVARGFVDVLRLGTGISDSQSSWENFKGGMSNGLRILAIAGPLMRMAGAAANSVGLSATSRLKDIAPINNVLPTGPCSYVATNNVLSYLSGRTVQFFATLDDIIAVRGANAGYGMAELLHVEKVASKLQSLGIRISPLNLKTVEEVIAKARSGNSPLLISAEWVKPNGQLGKHAIMLAKDGAGNVKFLDYAFDSPGLRGFNSLAEMAAARPSWGPNFATQLRLIPSTKVIELTNRPIRAMELTDKFVLAIPIMVAARWAEGASAEQRIHNMLRSAWQFMSNHKKQSLLPPPMPSPRTLQVLEKVQIPAATPSGLGYSGRTPVGDAARAPRFDWLTGVQYRLRYLNYYDGEIHGNNDEATKEAVLKFQKEWFKEKSEWDGIPGPRTQARLKLVVGW